MVYLFSLLSTVSAATTIFFKATYENFVDGPLNAGNVTINYDMARAKCPKVSSGGKPLWNVHMYAKLNGTELPAIQVFDPRGNRETILNVNTGSLSLWFRCSSVGGTVYDSNYGKNFQFEVTKP
jgi:hypothetical protein